MPSYHYLIRVTSPAGRIDEQYFPPDPDALDDDFSPPDAALVTAKKFLPNSTCVIVLEIGGDRHGKPVRREVK